MTASATRRYATRRKEPGVADQPLLNLPSGWSVLMAVRAALDRAEGEPDDPAGHQGRGTAGF